VSPVLTRPRPPAARAELRREIAAVCVAAVVALAVILGVSAAVEGPSYVDRVTVRNATPYPVEVSVAGDDRDGWLDLGAVSPGERRAVGTVVDHGDRWVARVSSAGTNGGQVEIGRDELARRDWVFTIGDDVTARLADSGLTPPGPPR
jgi:hypothetical protein